MGRLGVWELLIIFAVLLLLFGGAKLPQLGASLGSAIKNFKRGFEAEAPEEKPREGGKASAALTESGSIAPAGSEKTGSKQA